MFTVLSIEKRKDTLFEKIFGIFIKDKYFINTIPVYKGAPFYQIDIQVGKRGVEWERIVESVGKCALKLVMNDEECLPDKKELRVFKSNKLHNKMMLNTFLSILENNTEKTPVSVCIADKKAANTDFAEKIAPYALNLTVITDDKRKYIPFCDEIMQMTGLCPTLKEKAERTKIFIDTDNCVMNIAGLPQTLTVSDGIDFTVPELYSKLLPENIDKYDFYSALYELCGVFSLADCVFDNVLINGEKKQVNAVHFS